MRRPQNHSVRLETGRGPPHHDFSQLAPLEGTAPITQQGFKEPARTPLIRLFAKPLLRRGLKLPDHKSKPTKSVRESFLKALSHELRTPLAVALGYSEILHNQMLGPLNLDQENALTTIIRNSKTLCAVINDVISILEIQAGSIGFERQIFDPLSLLDELRTSFAAPCEKAVRLKWDLPATLPLMQTDRGKLSQILSHLIDYVINFTDQETVIVRVRRRGRQWIEFNVAESGERTGAEKFGNKAPRCRPAELDGRLEDDSRMLGLYVIKSLTAILGGRWETLNDLDRGLSLAVSFPVRN